MARTAPTVAMLLFCLITQASSEPHAYEAPVGSLFFTVLSAKEYFPDTEEGSISISVSRHGGAPLPSWLGLDQSSASRPAVLYGTPGLSDAGGLEIEIKFVRRKDSAKVERDIRLEIKLSTLNHVRSTWVTAYVTDMSLQDFLERRKVIKFARLFTEALQASRCIPLKVSSSTVEAVSRRRFRTIVHVDARVSKRSISCSNCSSVVGVSLVCNQTSRTGEFLSAARSHCRTGHPSFLTRQFVGASFDIEWCSLEVHHRTSPQLDFLPRPLRRDSAAQDEAAADNGTAFVQLPSAAQGDSTALVVILVVAAVIAVLVVSGLGWVFFGGKRQWFYLSHKKRAEQRVLRAKGRQFVRETIRPVATVQERVMDLSKVSLPASGAQSSDSKAAETTDESMPTSSIAHDQTSNEQPSTTGVLPSYLYPIHLLTAHKITAV